MKLERRLTDRVPHRRSFGKGYRLIRTKATRGLWRVILTVASAAFIGAGAATVQAAPPSTGLKLWLAADTGVTLDGSGGVSTWSDQSGNGNDATQATAANRPTVTANALNGKPVVHFNGASTQYFTLPNLLNGASAGEVLVVLKATAASGSSNRGLWYFGTDPWDWYPYSSGGVYTAFGSNAQKLEGTPTHDITQYHVYDVRSSSALWESQFDGVTFFKNSTNTVAFSSTPYLGCNGNNYGFDGDIAEILIYDHVLSDADRKTASVYLAQKYAYLAAPETPTIVTAKNISSTQALICWTNTALTQKTTDYIVERKDGPSGSFAAVATITDGQSFLDTGLTTGLSYTYRVYAQNWGGASGYSSSASLTDSGTGSADFPTTGLRLWLAADGAPLSPLNNWTDWSGNGNDGWQAVTGNRPTVALNALNGKPVVHFVGSVPQYFALPNLLSGATSGEILAVVRATTASGYNSGLWYFGTDPWDWYPYSSGGVYTAFGSNAQKLEGFPSLDITQYHIYNCSSQAGFWQSSMDGFPDFSTTSNTVAFNSTPFIGRNGNNYGFYGDIAEVPSKCTTGLPLSALATTVGRLALVACRASFPLPL